MNDKLDLETVNVLKEALGDEFDALIEVFLGDAPKRIAEIDTAFSAQDYAAMEAPAHTLKGSSGNVGAIALSIACAELLEAVRAGDASNYQQQLSQIHIEFDVAKSLLEAL